MSAAEQLAEEFHAVNDEAVDFATTCTPEQWAAVTSEEGWTVAATVHHIALGHELVSGWIDQLRRGEPVDGEQLATIDDDNAEHASEFAKVTVEETVSLLESNGADTEAVIRSLTEDELARSASFGGQLEMTCQRAVGAALSHARRHLDSALSAAGVDD